MLKKKHVQKKKCSENTEVRNSQLVPALNSTFIIQILSKTPLNYWEPFLKLPNVWAATANLVKLSVERLSTEKSCFLCGKAEGDTTVPLRNPFNLYIKLPQELPGKCLAEPLLPTTKATNPSQTSTASLSHKICSSKATNHRCNKCSYTRALDKILEVMIYNTSCVSCCLAVRGCHWAPLHTLGTEWDTWLPCKCCTQSLFFIFACPKPPSPWNKRWW